MSRSFLEPLFGVMVSMSCPSAGASPYPFPVEVGLPDPRGGSGPVGPQAMNRGLASSNAAT